MIEFNYLVKHWIAAEILRSNKPKVAIFFCYQTSLKINTLKTTKFLASSRSDNKIPI